MTVTCEDTQAGPHKFEGVCVCVFTVHFYCQCVVGFCVVVHVVADCLKAVRIFLK